jgi:mRNA-degrading endonuclease RelE of RelBE toxin-antitoxin system
MNCAMKWNLHVAGPARKSLKQIPDGDRKRILAALESMRQDPFSGDIARLKGLKQTREGKNFRPHILRQLVKLRLKLIADFIHPF